MSILRRLIQFFQIQNEDAKYNLARFKILSRQVPLLYAIYIINISAASFTHFTHAPNLLTLVLPGILVALILIRAARLHQAGAQKLSAPEVRRWLQTTILFSSGLALSFVTWALFLFNFGTVFTQGHLAFFICLNVVASVLGVNPLRQVAVLSTVATAVPVAIFFVFSGQILYAVMAFNMVCVASILLAIMFIHYQDYKNLFERVKILATKTSDLETRNKEYARLANLDSLTNLANRRCFFSELDTLTEQMRDQKKTLVVGILDLDGFKPINDIFGHLEGDILLTKVA